MQMSGGKEYWVIKYEILISSWLAAISVSWAPIQNIALSVYVDMSNSGEYQDSWESAWHTAGLD